MADKLSIDGGAFAQGAADAKATIRALANGIAQAGFRKDSLFMVIDSRSAGEVLAVVGKVAAGDAADAALAKVEGR